MKKFILGLIVLGASTLVNAHSDVNFSLNAGIPAYGIVNINNAPPPVIYQQPVVIHRTRTVYQPTYMYVPETQYRNWDRYCGRYGACGRPVYFIQNSYYERPRHRGHGHGWGHKKHYYEDRYHEHRQHGRGHW